MGSIAALHVTNPLHWFILILLSTVLIFLLFTLRTPENLFFNLTIGAVGAIIYFILLLLWEVDSNSFLEEQLACKDTQVIFRSLGQLPYYPAWALDEQNIVPLYPQYRIGTYTNLPSSHHKKITICNSPKKGA